MKNQKNEKIYLFIQEKVDIMQPYQTVSLKKWKELNGDAE